MFAVNIIIISHFSLTVNNAYVLRARKELDNKLFTLISVCVRGPQGKKLFIDKLLKG